MVKKVSKDMMEVHIVRIIMVARFLLHQINKGIGMIIINLVYFGYIIGFR